VLSLSKDSIFFPLFRRAGLLHNSFVEVALREGAGNPVVSRQGSGGAMGMKKDRDLHRVN
jgi:hypothetical protein